MQREKAYLILCIYTQPTCIIRILHKDIKMRDLPHVEANGCHVMTTFIYSHNDNTIFMKAKMFKFLL